MSSAVVERTTPELFDLILWLPDNSAFQASLEAKGDTAKALKLNGWGTSMELLLGSVNLLLDQTYVLVKANSKGSVQPPTKLTSPRDEGRPKKSSATDANAMAFKLMGR